MSLRKQTPSDFLKQIIGRPVVVKLNSGVDYRGKFLFFLTEYSNFLGRLEQMPCIWKAKQVWSSILECVNYRSQNGDK